MKVIRFSAEGFRPQKQTHHLKNVNYHLNGFDINEYPEHLRWEIEKIHKESVNFFTEHLDDLQSGIWCFIDGHKDNQSLNHLKRKVPCFEADLPDNTECYDCNWKKFTTITDPALLFGGCYVPERELKKLRNVHRRFSKRVCVKYND